jgi:hypothetical protein
MEQTLAFLPGQLVTLFLDTKNSDGYYADGYYEDGYAIDGYNAPVVQRLYKPDLTLDGYYPQPMQQLSTGLYYYQFTLPSTASAVGSYLASIAYREPVTRILKFETYLLSVNAPFGLYSVTTQ